MHGFLERVEGIDFAHKVEMGIRADRYKAMVPQVVGPLRLKDRVHAFEAQLARAHTKKKLKFTLPGPMTIADTIADRHYGDKVKMAMAFADLLNQEARALEKDGVDVIQFDEPAFNVFMGEVTEWGIAALERAAKGLTCTTAVHICYGYGIKANIDWKATLGGEWRQYEAIFPALAKSQDRAGVGGVPQLQGADEPARPARGQGHPRRRHRRGERRRRDARGRGRRSSAEVVKHVPKERIQLCTNCGMAPMRRDIAYAKLAALAQGRGAGADAIQLNAQGAVAACCSISTNSVSNAT